MYSVNEAAITSFLVVALLILLPLFLIGGIILGAMLGLSFAAYR